MVRSRRRLELLKYPRRPSCRQAARLHMMEFGQESFIAGLSSWPQSHLVRAETSDEHERLRFHKLSRQPRRAHICSERVTARREEDVEILSGARTEQNDKHGGSSLRKRICRVPHQYAVSFSSFPENLTVLTRVRRRLVPREVGDRFQALVRQRFDRRQRSLERFRIVEQFPFAVGSQFFCRCLQCGNSRC